ncbi:MAG: ABC transporter substrate-binding protein [Pseudomonadota bacterium]
MARGFAGVWLGLWCLLASEGVLAETRYETIDSFGKHYFSEPPSRVVVTDWTLLEQLIALGITPVGAPELADYRAVMPFETLDNSIEDIGLRVAPSLERIRALKPDLIIVGTDQRTLARPLSRVTRVLFYQNFSPRFKNNGTTARKRLGQLANVFQVQSRANELLAELDQTLADQRVAIATRFGREPVSVALLQRIADDEATYFSPHSVNGYVLSELGLRNVTDIDINKFGERRASPAEAVGLSADALLCLGDCRVETSRTIENMFAYGGVHSMIVLAERIGRALVQ